jgi:hypothetical protein
MPTTQGDFGRSRSGSAAPFATSTPGVNPSRLAEGRGLWTVAFYTYSHERYEATYFPNGEVHGTPEEAFDLGAIYLQ